MNILIVDDSKAMRAIVMRAVKAAGFGEASYREASNGKEALEAMRSGMPDLLLTDWNMPEMSGFELIQAVRAEHPALTIGMVTSESNPDLKQQAMEAGASFMLHKPFTPDAIKAALQTAVPGCA